jgi:D-alanyl-lipoteichoic acid acyltransferase DltB (MBOAT superfamily)
VLFNSLIYPAFLFVVVLVSWALLAPRHKDSGRAVPVLGALRLGFLLVASWLFYMVSDPRFIALILFSTLNDFFIGRALEDTPDARAGKRKALLWASLVSNLGLLGVFKYTDFFLQSVNDAGALLGADPGLPLLHIALPVGISFYTFQTMSYSIDVYRRRMPAERSLLRFALFVAFFPQLVAGPIVRAIDFLPQVQRDPKLSADQVSTALFRIAQGLIKKVLVADYVAVHLVDKVFGAPEAFGGLEILVALYAYTLQIYCDFSGYSDVAIGSARLLGYRLPENFERPYVALTVADFWRRWHMTLSGWLRDYVFFPLGGSRGSMARTYFNTYVTLVLIGLWHGANWTFVVYGFIHGTAICINRHYRNRRKQTGEEIPSDGWSIAWRWLLTFHFVVLARILFRSEDFTKAGQVWRGLFSADLSLDAVSGGVWVMLALGFAAHLTPKRWVHAARDAFVRAGPVGQGAALAGVAALLGAIAPTEAVQAFIYFQF